MDKHARTKLAALALPPALFLAAQGGSCGGGRGGGANANAPFGDANAGRSAAGANRAAGGDSTTGGGAEGSLKGVWGGPHVRLAVGDEGAEVEFDCAHGRTGRIAPDPQGRFSVEGTLVPERGGPVRVGEQERGLRARYSGRVEGRRMTLTVSAAGPDEQAEPITYTLTRGEEAELTKCL